MNKELILNMVDGFINDNNEMLEDDFEDIFEFLSDNEKKEVYKLLIDQGIDIVKSLSDVEKDLKDSRKQTQEFEPIDLKQVNLTNEQLCVMYQRGDKNALTLLAIKNEGLLNQRAAKFANLYNHKLDFDDLKQYGFIGMKKAIERFDVTKETKFSTYAVWWIDQAIRRNIVDNGFTIRIPVHLFEKVSTMMRLQSQYSIDTYEDLINVMQEKTEYTQEHIDQLIFLYNYIVKPTSLDLPVGEEEDSTVMDFVEEEDKNPTENTVFYKILKETLNNVLDTLTERERKIMRLRFGLDDGESRTLETVGKEFNVTRERIRQIEAKALKKLRHPARSKVLRDFYVQ